MTQASSPGGGGAASQVVFAWGAGEDGQLGLEEAETGSDEWHVGQPVCVRALTGLCFRSDTPAGGVHQPVVGGSRQSLCVTGDGALYCWGWNEKHALGLGHRNEVITPHQVPLPPGVHVQQAAWGGWHGVAVTDAGEAYAWGGNENLQTGTTDDATPVVPVPRRTLSSLRVRQVAAGGMHTLALADSGDVWAWGQPLITWGTTADANMYAKQRTPFRVDGAVNCVRIASGAFHNMALTATGHVLSWGNSDYGQLGLGSTTHVPSPHVIEELSKAGVTALAAGGWHSAVITAGGLIYIWGRGEHGRLGLGDGWKDRLRPVELPLAARATAVSCGGTHSVALTEHGTLLSFGRQSFGRLGRSASTDPNVPGPVELPPPPPGCTWRVDAASAGGRHTLALVTAVPCQPAAGPDSDGLHSAVDDAPAAFRAAAAVRGSLTPSGAATPVEAE